VKNAVKRTELKTSDKFDLYDPASRELLLECREPNIGGLTQLARAIGGDHDHGTKFDFIGRIPGTEHQTFRLKRGNTSLRLGAPMQFLDHQNQLIGQMEKKLLTLGLKFAFSNGPAELFVLQVKAKFLSSTNEILMGNKPVARLVRNWKADHADFFKTGKFSHAISIARDFPVSSPARQLLLAFCAAIHRVNA
jgi:hypothetical protein